eukprot:c50441_g1_i1.p2 GENE.c50441_g1_i1~~c50441_g1_i1.p2  ORF type:complete len:191 (-),score=32.80 c50441_g1_i1:22-594(-)
MDASEHVLTVDELRLTAAGRGTASLSFTVSDTSARRVSALDALVVAVLAVLWATADWSAPVPRLRLMLSLAALFWRILAARARPWRESVSFIHPVGLVLERESVWGASSRRLIDPSAIRDILVNEGIDGHQMRYYGLALVRAPSGGDDEVAVLFPGLLPRLPILQLAVRELRASLSAARRAPAPEPAPTI